VLEAYPQPRNPVNTNALLDWFSPQTVVMLGVTISDSFALAFELSKHFGFVGSFSFQ